MYCHQERHGGKSESIKSQYIVYIGLAQREITPQRGIVLLLSEPPSFVPPAVEKSSAGVSPISKQMEHIRLKHQSY